MTNKNLKSNVSTILKHSYFEKRMMFERFSVFTKLLFCFIALSFVPFKSVQACGSYYVSTVGRDSNPGTLAKPWKTIKYGANKIKACDTLFVRGGIYHEYLINISQSGTASSPVKITAYSGESPVIDGAGTKVGQWDAFFNLIGQYITVSGFEIRNGGVGVYLSGNYNTVSNLNVHHVLQNGILAKGDYSVVEKNQVHQTCLQHYNYLIGKGGTNGWASGLSAARNSITGITKNAIIRNNIVYDNWGEGLSTYEADGTLIDSNVVYDNYATNTYISDASNVIFRDNVVYNTPNNIVGKKANVLSLADEVASKPRSRNNAIINNFFYNGDLQAFAWTVVPGSGLDTAIISNNTLVNVSFETGPINRLSTVQNNIIYRNDGNNKVNWTASLGGVKFSKNFWSVAPTFAATDDFIGNPQLALTGSTAAGQLSKSFFALSASSPALGKGASILSVVGSYLITTNGRALNIGGYMSNPISFISQ